MRRGHALRALREAARNTEILHRKLDRTARSVLKKLIEKPGRSVMLVVVQKGDKHILGTEYVRVGYTANSDGSLDEIDELFSKEVKAMEDKIRNV